MKLINAFGTGTAFIRDNESDPKRAKNTLFYLDAVALSLIGLIGFFSAPYVAGFFSKKISDPAVVRSLVWMVRVVGLNQFLNIMAIVPQAMLTKELQEEKEKDLQSSPEELIKTGKYKINDKTKFFIPVEKYAKQMKKEMSICIMLVIEQYGFLLPEGNFHFDGSDYKIIGYSNVARIYLYHNDKNIVFSISTPSNIIKLQWWVQGEVEIKKWASLIALAQVGADKPPELMRTALIRAKFCEAISKHTNLQIEAQNAFMLGLFSVIEAIVDLPIDLAVKDIPIADEVVAALKQEPGNYKECLDIILFFEFGQWPELIELAKKLNIEEKLLPDMYEDAIQWASESLSL